jgi:hypothetical protein
MGEEADFLLHVFGYRDARLKEVHRVGERLASLPTNLARLEGADVYLFIVESYGHTVFAAPENLARVRPALDRFARRTESAGFGAVSGYLSSPTYAGSSWLAHATLATGVKTSNQFQYDLLLTTEAPTIAGFFRDAGYRTVHVLPGTTRPWPEGEFYRFEQKYYRWHFDYAGPKMGWGAFPDQYILDFVRRKELAHKTRPLFLECALVASHAPWNVVPDIIDDWDAIGRGAVYADRTPRRFKIDFSNLEDGLEPYLATIAYDFESLGRFIERFVDPGSLVIIIGDHQPAVQVTGKDQPWSVPVHVLGRPDHLTPFLRRGYAHGLVPGQPLPHLQMNEFLPRFLEDFSTRVRHGRG